MPFEAYRGIISVEIPKRNNVTFTAGQSDGPVIRKCECKINKAFYTPGSNARDVQFLKTAHDTTSLNGFDRFGDKVCFKTIRGTDRPKSLGERAHITTAMSHQEPCRCLHPSNRRRLSFTALLLH